MHQLLSKGWWKIAFGEINLSWCVVYLDDIIVFGKTPEKNLQRLAAVFEKLRHAKLKSKPSKYNFLRTQISYLGHLVFKEGISTEPSKIEAVKNWPKPKTLNDIRSFLGFVGYYRKFIQNFSSKARPFSDLLQGQELSKESFWRKLIECGPEQQIAFDELKEVCCVAPVLAYANYTQPFILHTDSSLDGLGSVLYHKDLGGQLRVIAYASRSLNISQRNYCAHNSSFKVGNQINLKSICMVPVPLKSLLITIHLPMS